MATNHTVNHKENKEQPSQQRRMLPCATDRSQQCQSQVEFFSRVVRHRSPTKNMFCQTTEPTASTSGSKQTSSIGARGGTRWGRAWLCRSLPLARSLPTPGLLFCLWGRSCLHQSYVTTRSLLRNCQLLAFCFAFGAAAASTRANKWYRQICTNQATWTRT